MTRIFRLLALCAALPLAAAADTPAAANAPVLTILPAAEVDIDTLLYTRRPIVVFADTPSDPNFRRQMQLIDRDPAELAERDVVVITDTDPAAMTALRKMLRPRGFSLVILDKDLRPVARKPLPWDVRELANAIDKFPLRRQEELERNPAGR